jgi:zinc transporter ZupT
VILLIDKILFNNSDIIEEQAGYIDLRMTTMRKSNISKKEIDIDENFQELVSHNLKFGLTMSKLNTSRRSIEVANDNEYRRISLGDNNRTSCFEGVPEVSKRDEETIVIDFESGRKGNEKLREQLIPEHEHGANCNHSHEVKRIEAVQGTNEHEHGANCNHSHEVKRIEAVQGTNEHEHGANCDKQQAIIVSAIDEKHVHGQKCNHAKNHHDGHDHHGHDHDGHDHHGHHHATVKKGASYGSAIAVLSAMGIHGLFEGLAYGVSTTKSEIFAMSLALGLHKWCDSLIVGVSLVSAELPFQKSLILTLFLSMFTPVGILIGAWCSENNTTTGVFQAISAGTFLYISCAEIIIEEFTIASNKYIKFVAYSVGVIMVCLMNRYLPHIHEHPEHH